MTKMEPTHQFAHIVRSDEAAPGVERIDVEAVGSKKAREFYANRPTIYPKLAKGTFRRAKWIVMAVTLGIYYLLPWIRWDRGPNLPDQAFLLDFDHQRLFFGPLEIWAQELYFITGLLVVSALGLFLVTSIAGRVWCGYTCPQTVWTDLMIAVERFWQGDRNARMRLDQAPWSLEKIWKKTATHLSWLVIGLATGGALVFYFRDAPTLAQELHDGHRSHRRLRLPRHLHGLDLSARRHRPRAGLHLHVPVAAHPGRDARHRFASDLLSRDAAASRAGRTRRASPGRTAATASTARPASPSVPWASTSATARSSSASSARSASTPATTS